MSDTENQEIDNEQPVEAEIVNESQEHQEPEAKAAEEKPISTRDAIKNALKEAKEKDENPKNTRKTEHTKPISAAKDDKAPKTASTDAVQAPAQAAKPLEAPRSWPAGDKAEFAKLAPNIQNRIIEREKNMEAVIGKAGQTAEYGNRIKETFTPYDAIITAEGGTHEKAIKELLNSAYILRRGTPIEKARMVADTMRRFGVDLRVLNGQAQTQQQAPNINKLVEDGVKSQLQKFQDEQALQSANREWQTFQNDPAHPHCELVWQDMQALLSGGRATGYQDAYDKAVWAHPELRSTLIDQTTEQRNAELKKQNDAKRRAGSSLSGAPGKSSSTPQQKTGNNTREDIKLAMAQVRGGESF